ncbi:MAG: iron export ABC transporter permease subunit FetB [Proteobacteria bacterium]|nr:MAG: iron export ABC transporter permease subunit FetB [Pseudomonadota bacterium]
MKGVTPISTLQLALSVGLVLGAGAISTALRLGLLRSLLWGTLRTFLQLTLIGYALQHVFAIDHPALVAALVGLMTLVAARAVIGRLRGVPFKPYAIAALSLAAGTYLVGTLVCALLIGAERWWTARISIPIAGMILGNTLNGISLSLERFVSDVRAAAPQVEQLLCLGHSPWEAVRRQVKSALRAGMTPTINALMIVGLVSLPGMMTGQILAGVDPLTAVRYQIVVMMMVAASVTLGCLLLVGLSYKRCFTKDGALLPELLADDS